MAKVFGVVVGPDGSPKKRVVFSSLDGLGILDNYLVISGRIVIDVDPFGRFEIDLEEGNYGFSADGEDVFNIAVPAQGSVNVVDIEI